MEIPAYFAMTSRLNGQERIYRLQRHGPHSIMATASPIACDAMSSEVAIGAIVRGMQDGTVRPCSMLP